MTSIQPKAIPSLNPELAHKIEQSTDTGLKLFSAFEQRILTKTGRSALYFVNYGGDAESDPIKVGYSHNVRQRIQQYRTTSWKPVIAREILYVVSQTNVLQDRELDRASENDDSARVYAILQELDAESIHIAHVELAVHSRLKECGLHVRGEWFSGGLERLVQEAKRVIREDLQRDYLTHRSMGKMLANWKNEAGMR